MSTESFNLIDESDRGCVLVGAAMLEARLEKKLRHEITLNGMSNRYLNHSFDANGPLGTFSAKILISKGFGLISEDVFQDLMIVRKLRNQFAHSVEYASFDDEKIKAKVDSLIVIKAVKEQMKEVPRFSPVQALPQKHESVPVEWKYLAAGYVKYYKSLFCLAIQHLELEMLKFDMNRYPR